MPYRRIYRWLSPDILDKERANNRRWYQNRKEIIIIKAKKYREKNRLEINKRVKLNRQKIRLVVLSHYCAGNPRCACCGEDEYKFLSIDHINNNGGKHRRELGSNSYMYDWIIKNNYPKDFQVLCMNCNTAKGWYGICPHKLKKNCVIWRKNP